MADTKKTSSKEALRMVTEADIKADPRLLDAGVSAGMLYDFSNLSALPKDASFMEEHVEAQNDAKDSAGNSADSLDSRIKALDSVDTASAKVAARELKIRQATIEATDEASK